jgi:galactokinase
MSTHDRDEARYARALEAEGLAPRFAGAAAARLSRLLEGLHAVQTERGPADAWYVPGRLEVLGKHTDYAGGRSLICTVERGLCAVSARRSDGLISILDTRRGSSVVFDTLGPQPSVSWSNYPRAVLERLARNFPGAVGGADVLFDSDLPSASGMSSSSALMIAVLLAVVRVSELESSEIWQRNIRSAEDLAAYAATIENGSGFRELPGARGVGTSGGSEDHTAIICSAPDQIRQYSFRPTRAERTIRLRPDWIFAIAASGVRAQKTGNAKDDYNRAAERVARIVEMWRAASGHQDETLADAVASQPGAADRIRALLEADAALRDRFEHFLEESTVLVPAAGDQLERGDGAGLRATVARSQELAERLLCNQVPETIALARVAREHGAIAASAFGAGFGGSVWALVEQPGAQRFLDRWQNAYETAHPASAAHAEFFLSRPGPRAMRVSE